MKEVPLVSVLMTSYNREKYISQAIESVLQSSFTYFELIVVDDCSTDETVDIIRQFAAKDSRIRFYINEHNEGDYPNRRKAASYASGKYLKYVDSDDVIYPFGLETMVAAMEQFPEAGFGVASLPPDRLRPFPFLLNPIEAYTYHFFGPGLFHKGPLSVIFLREAYEAVGGFGTERMISDTDMWHRMALRYPVVAMQDGLVWQRRHAEQELSEQYRFIYKGEQIKWKYLKHPDCQLSRKQLKDIKHGRLKRYAGFIGAGIRRLNFQQVKTYLKCFRYVAALNLDKEIKTKTKTPSKI